MAEKKKEILDVEQLNLHKRDYSKILLIIGIVGLVICLVIAFVEMAEVVSTGLEWIYWIMLGLMILSGPYGFYMSWQYKKTQEIETRLPDFLRDVAEAGRFGMTLAQAIRVSSRGRYGRLTRRSRGWPPRSTGVCRPPRRCGCSRSA